MRTKSRRSTASSSRRLRYLPLAPYLKDVGGGAPIAQQERAVMATVHPVVLAYLRYLAEHATAGSRLGEVDLDALATGKHVFDILGTAMTAGHRGEALERAMAIHRSRGYLATLVSEDENDS